MAQRHLRRARGGQAPTRTGAGGRHCAVHRDLRVAGSDFESLETPTSRGNSQDASNVSRTTDRSMDSGAGTQRRQLHVRRHWQDAVRVAAHRTGAASRASWRSTSARPSADVTDKSECVGVKGMGLLGLSSEEQSHSLMSHRSLTLSLSFLHVSFCYPLRATVMMSGGSSRPRSRAASWRSVRIASASASSECESSAVALRSAASYWTTVCSSGASAKTSRS